MREKVKQSGASDGRGCSDYEKSIRSSSEYHAYGDPQSVGLRGATCTAPKLVMGIHLVSLIIEIECEQPQSLRGWHN